MPTTTARGASARNAGASAPVPAPTSSTRDAFPRWRHRTTVAAGGKITGLHTSSYASARCAYAALLVAGSQRPVVMATGARLSRRDGTSFRFVGEEGVAVDLVGACLFFADRAAEGIGGWSDLDVDEACVLEHLLPARTGQPAGDSAGPKVDVAQGLGRHRPTVRDVGELELAAGSHHAPDLGEHDLLVRTEVDDPVRDDDVGPSIVDRDRFGEPLAELDLTELERVRGDARLLQHLRCHVDTDDPAGRTDLPGRDERVEAGTRPDVDHALPWLEMTQRERIADAGERLDRAVRQRAYDGVVVAELGRQGPTRVE